MARKTASAKCSECGNEFKPINSKQLKCVPCIKKANGMDPKEVKCAIAECRNTFIPRGGQKYCPSCQERIKRGPQKFYSGKGLAPPKEEVPIKPCNRKPIKIRKDGPVGVLTQEEQNEWLRCAVDCEYFLDNYAYITDAKKGRIPFKLFNYHKRCISDFDNYRFNVILKPRQMGISWLAAGRALWTVLFQKDRSVLMISEKEAKAVKLLNKVKYIYKYLPLFLQVPEKELQTNQLAFRLIKQNSSVEAVPSDPDAGRSESLSLLIMDECAFIRDARDIWKAAYHTLSTGGDAILLSTANGVGNVFHEVWTKAIKKENDFNPILLHWRDYPGRDDEWYATQKRNCSAKDMAQEVDCNFLQSGSPVFDAEYLFEKDGSPILLASVLIPVEGYGGITIYQPPIPGRRYLKGVDSSEGDGTDFCHMIVLDFETLEEVANIHGKWRPGVYGEKVDKVSRMYPGPLGVERTGMGLAVIIRLQDLGTPQLYYHEEPDRRNIAATKSPKPGWVTSPKSKPVMIAELEEAWRNSWIRFASRIYCDEGLVFNYEGDKMKAAPGYNDDSIMAAAIAYQMRKHVSRLTFGSIAI